MRIGIFDFAYSCKVEITVDNVHSLLRASCSLDVEDVRDACCDFIGKRLNSENVLFTRKMAEELHCSSLVQAADACLCQNFDEIAKTDEFLRMPSDFLIELFARDDLRTASEENVFQALMKWIKVSPGERKDKLLELLRRVRLIFLAPEYLMRHVLTEEYIRSSIPCRDLLDKVKFYQFVPHMRTELVDLETKARTCPERKDKKSGGRTDGIYTVRKCLEVQHFDPENEKWEVMASTHVYNFCTLTGNPEKLFFIESDYIRRCSLPECKWEEIPIFVGRTGAGVAVLDNCMYICGGTTSWWCVLNEVKRIDLLKNIPYTDIRMSVSRNLPGVVALGGCLYALGGNNIKEVLDSVERFDPKTGQWKFLCAMKSKRYGMGCTTTNNKIYVCGGKSSFEDAPVSSVEVYDPFVDQWKYISPMTSGRCRCSLVTYCGRLYTVGGYDQGLVYLCSAEVYDPENDEWKISPSMDCSRKHAKAARFPSVSN